MLFRSYDVADVAFSHDGERCSFDVFLRHYNLRDPALAQLADIEDRLGNLDAHTIADSLGGDPLMTLQVLVTTAQQAHAKGSAQNLAALVRRHWPQARCLVVDSERPEAAELLGADPNGTAAAHDWIIASPSITSGLSIDAAGRFDAVVVLAAGGRLPAEHLAQAAARVRDPACPVWVYAPAVAPQLRIGSGDTSPARLLEHLARCEARLLADLVGAAGWDSCATNESPWLRCWLEIAAARNAQAAAYASSVAADRKSTRLNSSHVSESRMPSSA